MIQSFAWYISTNCSSQFTGIRTGKYETFEDTVANPAYQGLEGGIYNEDMAAAIVDEVEDGKYDYKHWTCTGPIGLKEW